MTRMGAGSMARSCRAGAAANHYDVPLNVSACGRSDGRYGGPRGTDFRWQRQREGAVSLGVEQRLGNRLALEPLALRRSPVGRRVKRHACGRQQRPAADVVRRFLAEHDRRRVEVAVRDRRHDRGIDDAQALEADHPRLRIDHGHRIVADRPSCRCRRDDRRSRLVARTKASICLVRHDIGAGLDLRARDRGRRRLARRSRASGARRRASRSSRPGGSGS